RVSDGLGSGFHQKSWAGSEGETEPIVGTLRREAADELLVREAWMKLHRLFLRESLGEILRETRLACPGRPLEDHEPPPLQQSVHIIGGRGRQGHAEPLVLRAQLFYEVRRERFDAVLL